MVKSLLPRDEVQGLASITGEAGSVLDFWKWAFSDLSDDDVKGWFAEWLVAKLIGVNTERRISWANSDIITPEGVRIEVQSSAYWQSWKLINEDGTPKLSEPLLADARTRVRFGGLFTADSVAVAKGTASHKSHLYVFAFHGERDPGAWDALIFRLGSSTSQRAKCWKLGGSKQSLSRHWKQFALASTPLVLLRRVRQLLK